MAKLTNEELQAIKNLRENYQNLVIKIGENESQIMSLEMDKLNLKDQLSELRLKEQNLIQTIEDKYGQGTISLDTGEINI